MARVDEHRVMDGTTFMTMFIERLLGVFIILNFSSDVALRSSLDIVLVARREAKSQTGELTQCEISVASRAMNVNLMS